VSDDWLFGVPPAVVDERPPTSPAHRRMVGASGYARPDATCGTCWWLLRVPGNTRSYLKCGLNGITSSTASDWRRKWPACGRLLRKGTPMAKQYLGDGAYVEDGSYIGELILTTSNGVTETNRVVIDEHGLKMLNRFAAEQKVRVAQQTTETPK
jgi:hypothetical protein